MGSFRLKQDRLLNKMTMVTRPYDRRYAPPSVVRLWQISEPWSWCPILPATWAS